MVKYTLASKTAVADLITADDVLKSYYEFVDNHPNPPLCFEVSPEIYGKLTTKLAPDPLPADSRLQSIYGVKIKIDPSLKPGEWKII